MSAVLTERVAEALLKREEEKMKTLRLFRRNTCLQRNLPYEEDSDLKPTEATPQPQPPEEDKLGLSIQELAAHIAAKIKLPASQPLDVGAIADQVAVKIKLPVPTETWTTHQLDTAELASQVLAGIRIPTPGRLGWKDLLKIGAISLLGTSAIAAPVSYWFANQQPAPVVQVPSESVLQNLEDTGFSVWEEENKETAK